MFEDYFIPIAGVEEQTAMTDWYTRLQGDTEHARECFARATPIEPKIIKHGNHRGEAEVNADLARRLSAA